MVRLFPLGGLASGPAGAARRGDSARTRCLGEGAARRRRSGTRGTRQDRLRLSFGGDGNLWDEERALERYELCYEAGLLAEAERDGRPLTPGLGARPYLGRAMQHDHRRILATAITRLRGKLKYRPVIFELMPAVFTLTELQRTVEAISGRHLHKQNFRRLVETTELVEPTGATTTRTGGRPGRAVPLPPPGPARAPRPGPARRGAVNLEPSRKCDAPVRRRRVPQYPPNPSSPIPPHPSIVIPAEAGIQQSQDLLVRQAIGVSGMLDSRLRGNDKQEGEQTCLQARLRVGAPSLFTESAVSAPSPMGERVGVRGV